MEERIELAFRKFYGFTEVTDASGRSDNRLIREPSRLAVAHTARLTTRAPRAYAHIRYDAPLHRRDGIVSTGTSSQRQKSHNGESR